MDLGYFCRGLQEETLHRLAQLDGLRVMAGQPGVPNIHGDASDPASHAAIC